MKIHLHRVSVVAASVLLGSASLACAAPGAERGLARAPQDSAVARGAVLEEGDRPDKPHLNLDRSGLVLSGYDPVAYFPEGGSQPKKGKAELSLKQGGVTWRFATEENRERFEASPAKFDPAYGGWCAYAMADGAKVEVDPESYLIQDGRLMLFYKGFLNDTRKKWQKKPADYQARADREWTRIVE